MDKFDIILADPPWPETRCGDRRKSVLRHFVTMSLQEILQIPVASIANPDHSLLFLWTTARHVPMACQTLATWGFKFIVTCFVWIKVAKNGLPIYNLGRYTNGNAELVLLGRRGKSLTPVDKCVKSVILAPRQQLAKKPEAVHRGIERMYPDQRKVELFARAPRPGWVTIGNAIDSQDIMIALQTMLGERSS